MLIKKDSIRGAAPIYLSSPKSYMIFFIDSCNGGRSYPLKNPGSLAIPLSYGNHFCQDSPANVGLQGLFHDQIDLDAQLFAQFILHAMRELNLQSRATGLPVGLG